MAEPNYEAAAQRDTEQQRRALLAALSQDGSRALRAYDDQRADVNAQRTAALKTMLAGAADRGAPASAQQLLSQTANAPYDRRAVALSDAQASQQRLNDSMATANSNYMGQASAAAPLVAQLAAARKAQTGADNAIRNRELALREKQLAIEERKLAEGADPFAALTDRYGVKGLNALLDSAGQTIQSGTIAKNQAVLGTPRGRNPIANYELREDTRQAAIAPPAELRRRAGTELGLSDADLAALNASLPTEDDQLAQQAARLRNAQTITKAGQVTAVRRRDEAAADAKIAAPEKLANHQAAVAKGYRDANGNKVEGKARPYDDAVSTAEVARKEKWTPAELQETLAEAFMKKYGHDYPQVRALVTAMYVGVLGGV